MIIRYSPDTYQEVSDNYFFEKINFNLWIRIEKYQVGIGVGYTGDTIRHPF